MHTRWFRALGVLLCIFVREFLDLLVEYCDGGALVCLHYDVLCVCRDGDIVAVKFQQCGGVRNSDLGVSFTCYTTSFDSYNA